MRTVAVEADEGYNGMAPMGGASVAEKREFRKISLNVPADMLARLDDVAKLLPSSDRSSLINRAIEMCLPVFEEQGEMVRVVLKDTASVFRDRISPTDDEDDVTD